MRDTPQPDNTVKNGWEEEHNAGSIRISVIVVGYCKPAATD